MNDCELELLKKAAADREQLSKTTDVYLKLRGLLADTSPDGERSFSELFSKYYGLNSAGLTSEWKEKYFSLLFAFREKVPDEPHRFALRELFRLPRRKGDNALQFSFVSKLVAIHDERQPLYDVFLQSYFGLGPPANGLPLEFRISGFLQNLNEIGRRYQAWAEYESFAAILRDLRRTFPGIANCHSVRICDFLVWSVGKNASRRDMAKGE